MEDEASFPNATCRATCRATSRTLRYLPHYDLCKLSRYLECSSSIVIVTLAAFIQTDLLALLPYFCCADSVYFPHVGAQHLARRAAAG